MGPIIPLKQPPALALLSAIADFLADCRLRGLSPGTLDWYKYTLQPFARFAASQGHTQADSVTHETVRAFLAQQATGVAPRRVNHYREAIYRLYEWLQTQGYAHANPAERLRKIREPQRLIATFTEAELNALLKQPDTRTFLGLRDYVFMLLLLDTGVRLSEALGLQVSDVDLQDATLKVLGKGRKERLVGVSPGFGRCLRLYLGKRDEALRRAAHPECPWVFPNQNGGKGGAKGFQMRLKRYGDQAGITRVRVSPHTFRHTFAVWFVRKGGSPFHLQRILGHTSLDMSRRYCELADIDAITKQREFSPLGSMRLSLSSPRRLR